MGPAGFVAVISGWIVAEVGRQPWAIEGVLPTFLGTSSLTVPQLWATIIGFTVFYGALAVVEVGLLLHAIKKGPFHEQQTFETVPDTPSDPSPGTRAPAAAVA